MVSVTTRLPEPLRFPHRVIDENEIITFHLKKSQHSIYSAHDEISLSDVANLDLVQGGGLHGILIMWSFHV